MNGPRFRLARRFLGLVLVPPLLWAAILWVVPTGWARDLLVDQLRQATGRPVRLDALRFRALGGVRLENLQIGETAEDPDPWLRVAALRVDLNLAQLLSGRLRPRGLSLLALAGFRRCSSSSGRSCCAGSPLRAGARAPLLSASA